MFLGDLGSRSYPLLQTNNKQWVTKCIAVQVSAMNGQVSKVANDFCNFTFCALNDIVKFSTRQEVIGVGWHLVHYFQLHEWHTKTSQLPLSNNVVNLSFLIFVSITCWRRIFSVPLYSAASAPSNIVWPSSCTVLHISELSLCVLYYRYKKEIILARWIILDTM